MSAVCSNLFTQVPLYTLLRSKSYKTSSKGFVFLLLLVLTLAHSTRLQLHLYVFSLCYIWTGNLGKKNSHVMFPANTKGGWAGVRPLNRPRQKSLNNFWLAGPTATHRKSSLSVSNCWAPQLTFARPQSKPSWKSFQFLLVPPAWCEPDL